MVAMYPARLVHAGGEAAAQTALPPLLRTALTGWGSAWAPRWWSGMGWLRWPFGKSRPDTQWPAVTAVMVGPHCHVVRVEISQAASHSFGVRLVHAEEGGPEMLRPWRQRGWFAQAQTLLVLPSDERHFLTFDQPEVPAQDLALAVRYPLCEALDCEPETLLTTAVTMPRINDALRPQVLAVAARLQPVRERLATLAAAGITARAVDISDSALRGMVMLARRHDEGCIVLCFVGGDICIGLLWQGQFCALRSLALPLRAPDDEAEFEEQLALHIQRTADHFERQATQLAVRQVLASMPALDSAAQQSVLSALPLPAQVFDLQALLPASPLALEACSGHNDLTALACVAAARLLDNRAGSAAPGSSAQLSSAQMSSAQNSAGARP